MEKQTKLKMSVNDWREVEIETKAQMHAAFCKMTLAKILYEEALHQIKIRGGKTYEENARDTRERYEKAKRRYTSL